MLECNNNNDCLDVSRLQQGKCLENNTCIYDGLVTYDTSKSVKQNINKTFIIGIIILLISLALIIYTLKKKWKKKY